MKRLAVCFLLTACSSASPTPSPTASTPTVAPVEEPTAPQAMAADFSLEDLDGNTVELASLRGKTVVLEWFNPGCPFVKYAHGEGPLKDLAAKHLADGVAWLAINSSAPGNEGHGVGLNRSAAASWKITHPVLLDEDGTVGRLYEATSTPAMFVINPSGELIYRGALDTAPLGRQEGDARNYVEEAIEAAKAGKLPEITETQSYGCSVKYANN